MSTCTISKKMLATLLLSLFTANIWLQKEKRSESVWYYYYYSAIFVYEVMNVGCWKKANKSNHHHFDGLSIVGQNYGIPEYW